MSATHLCTYRYDPLDRLTCHTVMTHAPVQRFYCKSRLTTEIEGAISRSIVQHGDQLLAQSETQGSAKQATLLATDQQRSVLHAVSSNERQSHAYSPYGNRTIGNGFLSLLGFNGERPDPVTGHYLLGNGYRAFNPVLMRFNSSDKLSPFGKGGINSYAYCSGDPINRSDPNGRMGISSLWRWVSAALFPARPRIHLSGPEVVFNLRGPEIVINKFSLPPKGYYVVKTTIQRPWRATEGIETIHKKTILSTLPQRLEEAAFSILPNTFDPRKYTRLFQNKIDHLSRVNFFNYLQDRKTVSRLQSPGMPDTGKINLIGSLSEASKVRGINMFALEKWKYEIRRSESYYSLSGFHSDGRWESDFLAPLGLRLGFE
ncbi:RHS repeat-associated core domain-containing protein [Pseudomonas sp. LARHCG127]